MHTLDADILLAEIGDINGLTISWPAELTVESTSLFEYSSKENT